LNIFFKKRFWVLQNGSPEWAELINKNAGFSSILVKIASDK